MIPLARGLYFSMPNFSAFAAASSRALSASLSKIESVEPSLSKFLA